MICKVSNKDFLCKSSTNSFQAVCDLWEYLGSPGSEAMEIKVTDIVWFCYTAYCFQ